MQLNNIADTALGTAFGTTAIIGAPVEVVDMQTAKAALIAFASTVVYKLAVAGLKWLSGKISKIGKKDDNDQTPKMELSA